MKLDLLREKHGNFIHRSRKLNWTWKERGAREGFAAGTNGFELVNVEFLVDDADLEVDAVGGWQIDPDLVDVEPDEEALDLNALEIGDGAIAELAGDLALVVNQVIELYVAGLRQNDDELPVLVERVVGDGVR